jgi:putative endonuclease
MFGSRQLGKEGEDKGVRYLKSLGYKILTRNFHSRFGEIDIVAQEKDTIVFVEVKTRSDNEYGPPEESITPWKLARLLKACQYFCLKNNINNSPLRLDVLAIENLDIRHIKNITL